MIMGFFGKMSSLISICHFPMQPQTGIVPIPPSRSARNTFDFGRLLDGETTKIAEYYEISSFWILIGKSCERFVKLNKVICPIPIGYS